MASATHATLRSDKHPDLIFFVPPHYSPLHILLRLGYYKSPDGSIIHFLKVRSPDVAADQLIAVKGVPDKARLAPKPLAWSRELFEIPADASEASGGAAGDTITLSEVVNLVNL
jgi:hypothetical protein